MEVIEHSIFIYDVSFNLSILKEVDILKYKIYYSYCGLVNLLRPTTIKNKHLLKDCDFNITKFNEEMKKNTTIDHYMSIEFETWKFYINPYQDEKYVFYKESQTDYLRINETKSKNDIDLKLYVLEESTGWNRLKTKFSFFIESEYQVGYPVQETSKKQIYQGFHEEFIINFNKKNYVRIIYMNIYEFVSLIGGYVNSMTFIFRFISHLVTENNVQIYKFIKEFKKEQIQKRNTITDKTDDLSSNQSKNNSLLINDDSLVRDNDSTFEKDLSIFEKGHLKFILFRLYSVSCCLKNDKRNDIIDFVKDSFSIYHLQRKLNELELFKDLLLDEDKILKIRQSSRLGNTKMISMRYEEFKKSDTFFISNKVKSRQLE